MLCGCAQLCFLLLFLALFFPLLFLCLPFYLHSSRMYGPALVAEAATGSAWLSRALQGIWSEPCQVTSGDWQVVQSQRAVQPQRALTT